MPEPVKKRKIPSKVLANAIAKCCYEKKGKDIVIMDMTGLNFITDYFVLCTVVAPNQVNAIFKGLEEYTKQKGKSLVSSDMSSGEWAIFDYGNVTCHCMSKEKRDFYNLESLWYDAPIVKYKGSKK